MDWKKKLFWTVTGLLLVFFQSFFIINWPAFLWVVLLTWIKPDPWWIVFAIGLVNDLLLVNPSGKSVLIYLGLSLIVIWVKRIFGLGQKLEVKVNGFH